MQYAVNNGIINLAYVQEQIEMNKKKEVLEKYGSCIWYSEKEKVWYCHIPDENGRNGRKKIKRKKQRDIENIVYNYYSKLEFKNESSIMTFSDLFYEYMDHKKMQVKPATIKRTMVDWNKFYKPYTLLSDKPFKEITKIDVDDFLNYVAATYHPKDKNFKNICGILKQTFEYAVDADYIDKSPYRTSKVNKKNIIPNRKHSNEKEVFTVEEQQSLTCELIRKAESNPSYLLPWIILLDFEIGARIGEVLALRENDIDNNYVHICKQLVTTHDVTDVNNIQDTGWEIVEYTKSHSGYRKIPLTDNGLNYIKKIKMIVHNLNQYQDYLFFNPQNVITEHSVKSLLKHSCERIGMLPRSTHKIRKTYASRLYSRGVSVSDIKKLLGHADETTTMKHYIYSMDNDDTLTEKVKKALDLSFQVADEKKVTKSDQKIIQFPVIKKPQNPCKINGFKA